MFKDMKQIDMIKMKDFMDHLNQISYRKDVDVKPFVTMFNFFFFRNMSQDYEEIRDWTKFEASTRRVKWLNFHNHHKDRIKVSLRTTNRALNQIVNTTDGFVVDLTPPQLHYLWDGAQGKDREFQVRHSRGQILDKIIQSCRRRTCKYKKKNV